MGIAEDGIGVRGDGSPTGEGVFGFSDRGTGVFGRAFFGGTGVRGEAAGSDGRGVVGVNASGGTGVYGEAWYGDARGVVGVATNTDVGTGVYGQADGRLGRAVAGVATNEDLGTGVYGEASGAGATAISARATHNTGNNIAVRGEVDSPNGWAAYFMGGRNYFQGNVGIGTTNPTARLHLQTPSDNVAINFRAGGSWTAQIQQTDSSYFNFSNGGQVRLTIRAGGQVGIGTQEPGSFLLAVNGSAAKPGGGSWSSFSDARLKRHIRPLRPGTLDRLLSLRGYTFEYTPDAIERRLALPGTQTGLIAQEVRQVFPEWVDADEEGYLYVTERGTTALFVEALRELRQEKDAEIEGLREENERLRQRLEALERAVDALIESALP